MAQKAFLLYFFSFLFCSFFYIFPQLQLPKFLQKFLFL
jgi:hypothetical protein